MKALLYRVLLGLQAMQSRLIARLLGPNAAGVLVESRQGLFAVDPRDRGVGRRLLLDGSYGTEELERLRSYLPRSGRVLVVGAHIGSMAIPLAQNCGELIAVEPNPVSNRLLRLNLQLNAVTNCLVIDSAAGERRGEIEMLMSTANSGGSKRVPRKMDRAYVYDNPAVARVPCVPLDEAVGDHRFDLVLMDIEGSEYFALKGMPRILAASNVLAIEFLPHHLRNVSAISVEQFIEPLVANFDRLLIPSKSLVVTRDAFGSTLGGMFERDEGDDGLLFTKAAAR